MRKADVGAVVVVAIACCVCGCSSSPGRAPTPQGRQAAPGERLQALVNQTMEPDPARRGAAQIELRRLDDPAVVPLLTRTLMATKPPGFDFLLETLDLFDDPRKIPTFIVAVQSLDVINREGDAGRSDNMAEQMKRLGAPAVTALLDKVTNCVIDAGGESSQFRSWAARVVGGAGPDVLPLLRRAATDRDPCRRWLALSALGHVGRDAGCEAHEPCEARTILERALKDKVPHVAHEAEESIGHLDWEPSRRVYEIDEEDIAPLSDAERRGLASHDAAERLRVLESLEPPGRGREEAEAALRDPEKSVRLAAIAALARFGEGPVYREQPGTATSIEALARVLDDASQEVRMAAAEALGTIAYETRPSPGQPEVVGLVRRLTDQSDDVRATAAEALGNMRATGSGAPLLAMLEGHESPATRAKAARALGFIREPRAAPALARALSDKEPTVRQAAAEALENLYVLGETRPGPELVPPMIAALRDPDLRAHVVHPLGLARDPRAVLPLIGVIEMPLSGGVSRSHTVSAALVEIGDRASVEPLLPFLESQYPDTRCNVASALGKLKDARAIPGLTAALKDEDRTVRTRAATALADIGDRRVVPALVAALRDEDRSVRAQAATALADIGDRRAVPALAAALTDDAESVRGAVALALGRLGDPSAVDPLIRVLAVARTDDSAGVLRALGMLRDPRAVPGLIIVLDRRDRPGSPASLQSDAARALGEIGGPDAIAALERHLRDLDRAGGWAPEREPIEAALKKLGREVRKPR